MNNSDLIRNAEQYLNPIEIGGRLHGDVAASVIGKNGKIYNGVCVDTSSWGLCAERSALAAMVTDGCYEFEKVVAVWRDDKTSKLSVLPPCGHCREFMRSMNEKNLDAEIILGKTERRSLKELIPYYEWPEPLED